MPVCDPRHLGLDPRHRSSQTAGRSLIPRRDQAGLFHRVDQPAPKPNPPELSDCSATRSAMPMRPGRAAILIKAVQSQRQHPSRQPSPSLCSFHRHISIWQIGRTRPESVSNERYADGGKFVPYGMERNHVAKTASAPPWAKPGIKTQAERRLAPSASPESSAPTAKRCPLPA